MAKPCLLVKKSVLNCRTTELKVLCRSLGSIEPLSSLRRTPLSTGPSQMRSTSWTSSVSNTRKWSLDREKRQALTPGPTAFSQELPFRRRRSSQLWKIYREEERPRLEASSRFRLAGSTHRTRVRGYAFGGCGRGHTPSPPSRNSPQPSDHAPECKS